MEAVELPLTYDFVGRDGVLIDLLLHELTRMRRSRCTSRYRLTENSCLCVGTLHQPYAHQSPQQWADQLHISLRTFNRFFRQQTGLSFNQGRQRACVSWRWHDWPQVKRCRASRWISVMKARQRSRRCSGKILGQAPAVWLEAAN